MSSDRQSVLRILDANANRASEGLRVIEEYLRFVLQDRQLTEVVKQIRHDLAAAVQPFSPHDLLAARDTAGDVGTEIAAADEYARIGSRHVWIASQKRVEQSLRCLEEYSKNIDSTAAAAFERLRYRMYTVAKGIEATAAASARLADARLYVLIDGGPDIPTFERLVTDLITAGVSVVQLRDKTRTDRELIDRARRLRALTRGTNTLFIMNDRPDLAVLADADGVHVGQEELTVADARKIIGPDRLVGVSTHSLDQVRDAVFGGADYVGCGPTFPSSTKQFERFAGLEFLVEVAEQIRLPAFAIGGITVENVPQVIAAGFKRIAVSGAVTQAADPLAVVRRLLELLP